jgi:DNA-binding response OmpR family regulator
VPGDIRAFNPYYRGVEMESELVVPPPPERRSILMVEDDWTLSVPYGRALEANGFEVRVADSGKKAIKEAATSAPDLLVLDLALPDQTGFDVIRELRAAPVTAGLPIVILSGYHAPSLVKESEELGVLSYMVKLETSPQKFAETVRSLLAPPPAEPLNDEAPA